MKKKYILLAVVAAMFTSCSDELISEQNGTIKQTGDEIVFGGRAGFETNEFGENENNEVHTRTIYTGNIYNFNGKKFEGVQWQAGDKVRIYCPQANNYKTSDYTVNTTATGVTSGADSITGLTRINPDGALQWGNPEVQHDFYAVYPAPQQHIGENNSDSDILNGKTTFVGVIPGIQYREGDFGSESYAWNDGHQTGTGTRYIAKPNMDYAYMVAKTSVKKPNEFGNNIYLHFLPIVTAVEVTVSNLATNTAYPNGQDLSLANVLISCTDNDVLYGGFQADVAQIADNLDADGKDGTDGYGDAFTTDIVTAITGNTKISSGSQISIPMYKGTNGIYGDPLVLKHGDAVTFTVFMLPNADHSNLRITLQGIGGTKSAVINGAKILAKKKNYIRNLPLAGKNILPFTQAEWLKYVQNEVLLKDLSIPGAGGAASGDLDGDGSYATSMTDVNRQQNLSIEQLWNLGVRCFEFATDCTTDGNLGAQPVICNGESCETTLDGAISKIIESLNKHPEEFAMVILTYQCTGGWGARTPKKWMEKLNAYWPTKASSITTGATPVLDTYDPAGNMSDARGKLFCIARPTSINQDYSVAFNGTDYGVVNYSQGMWGSTTITTSTGKLLSDVYVEPVDASIVVINGWGALKDKWQQRGYSYESVRHITSEKDKRIGRPFDCANLFDHKGGGLLQANHNDDHGSITWNGSTWYGKFPWVETYSIAGASANDFSYTTSLGASKNAWVQEWARVSNFKQDGNAVLKVSSEECNHYGFTVTSGNVYRVVYWDNTRGEKINDIKETLGFAINKSKTDCVIYINSLCGYYIDADIPESCYPCALTDYNVDNKNTLSSSSQTAGLKGNISTFAKDMNTEFNNYLKSSTDGYVPGSMGIILMDRVGEDDNSKNIPSYIVSNNFKHDTGTQAVTLSEIKKTETPFDPNNEAPLAKPRNSEGGMTITWE